jgi:hypothetical protein
MLEPAVAFHTCIQGILPCMTKGRVPQIVRQSYALHQIFVQIQCARNASGYLSNFKTMR